MLWYLIFRPVSAYALFFRDTQAVIKGKHPNASFGEVSKIVASMWDALDIEHKNVSIKIHNLFSFLPSFSFYFFLCLPLAYIFLLYIIDYMLFDCEGSCFI